MCWSALSVEIGVIRNKTGAGGFSKHRKRLGQEGGMEHTWTRGKSLRLSRHKKNGLFVFQILSDMIYWDKNPNLNAIKFY